VESPRLLLTPIEGPFDAWPTERARELANFATGREDNNLK